MKAFREHVAISIDGGGIKGLIVARALEELEKHLDKPLQKTFQLTAGTSTGSIIAAGIAAGMTGAEMRYLYHEHGPEIFHKSWHSRFWPLTRYRYTLEPFKRALEERLGETMTMGDFWSADPPSDVIITAFDLADQRTRFIKPWKAEYKEWPVVTAVLASCAVPTYFPPVEGRYVDGGVGGYSNPCFLAAYEISHYLNSDQDFPEDPEHPDWHWCLEDTTLISLGTGRALSEMPPATRLWPWQWLKPLMDDFLHSANDQQVHLVTTLFKKRVCRRSQVGPTEPIEMDDAHDATLDFRRFQVGLTEPIEMDDARDTTLDLLEEYGKKLWENIDHDQFDMVQKETRPFKAV